MESTMAGNMNERDHIYRAIWEKWSTEDSFFNFVFGYGFCSSMDIAGNRAHNDWLEMLATAGLIGEITYICYYINLFRTRSEISEVRDKRVLDLILLILILKSLFSMSYCSVENMAIFLLLGFVIGRSKNISQNIQCVTQS